MQCLKGKSVYKGIVKGPVVVLKQDEYLVHRRKIEDAEAEILRLEQAVDYAKEQLQKLYDK